MIIGIKKSLITVIVLLQFIAPLLHAHIYSQHQPFSNGIHIPGLEFYNASSNFSNASFVPVALSEDTLTIGIASGIQFQFNDIDDQENDSQDDAWNTLSTTVYRLTPNPQINFSPPSQILFPSRYFHQAHTPRAPPIVS